MPKIKGDVPSSFTSILLTDGIFPHFLWESSGVKGIIELPELLPTVCSIYYSQQIWILKG